MKNIMHLEVTIDFATDISTEFEVDFMDEFFDLIEKYGGEACATYKLYSEKEWEQT